MLDQLDTIDWEGLNHAYGPATDVPELLRNLMSQDEGVCREAIHEFYGNIWHQGTVYEATAHAVPFLIELLNTPGVQSKDQIMALLQAIATGSSYMDVHGTLISSREREDPEYAVQLAQEFQHVSAAHGAVVQGAATYLNLLKDPDVKVRMAAPYLLAACGEQAEAIAPALREQIGQEQDHKVRASLVLGLGRLLLRPDAGKPEPASAHELELANFLDASHPPLVRLAAAIILLDSRNFETAAAAIEVMEAASGDTFQQWDELPWADAEEASINALPRALARFPELHHRLEFNRLRDPDPAGRVQAIYAAGVLCREERSIPRRVAPILGDLLSDPSREVRQAAATELSQIGSAAKLVVGPLLAALQDPSPTVRARAAAALGKLREERAISPLRTLLADQETRYVALKALYNFGPAAREAIPEARQIIGADGDRNTTIAAVLLLGAIAPSNPSLLPDLVAALSNPVTNVAAAHALAGLGAEAQIALPALMGLLSSQNEYARNNAVRAIGSMGSTASEAADAIAAGLADESGRARAAAALALFRITGEADRPVAALVDTVEQTWNATTPSLQMDCSDAAAALVEIGPPAREALPMLRKALRSDLHWARVQAARALWRIGGEVDLILPILIEEIQCRPAGMLVVECLAEMGPLARPAVPTLRRIVDSEARAVGLDRMDEWIDSDEAFCAAAARALEAIGPAGDRV